MSGYADAVEPQSNEVVLRVDPPTPQSRATIFFRIFLVLPQLVVLYFFGLVATLAGVAGWLVALFTGRVPDSIHEVLTTWTRSTAQVWGYMWLLSDTWPPIIARDDSEYAVDLRIPPPQRLNRLAVLFRLVLVVPAGIVAALAFVGLVALSFVFWLIALVKGRLPDTVHQATAATLRYGLRYNAYAWLLTPTYPRGLFGGRTLPLTAGAKRLVGFSMVFGVVAYGGFFVAAVLATDFDALAARSEVTGAYERFAEDTKDLEGRFRSCPQQPDPFVCARSSMSDASRAAELFYDNVRVIEFPADARDEATELLAAAAAFRDAALELATSQSAEQYNEVVRQRDIGALGDRFDNAYEATVAAL